MDLIEQYKEMHRNGAFKGFSVLKFADEIGSLIKQYGIETVLDYGSGQGLQYLPPHSLDKKWGVDVRMYDPAVPGLDTLPDKKFDMVICSDVLEHVPMDDVPDLLNSIFSYAERFAFLTVCTRPAKKTLPDGRNVHITLAPLDVWEATIANHAKAPFVLRETP